LKIAVAAPIVAAVGKTDMNTERHAVRRLEMHSQNGGTEVDYIFNIH